MALFSPCVWLVLAWVSYDLVTDARKGKPSIQIEKVKALVSILQLYVFHSFLFLFCFCVCVCVENHWCGSSLFTLFFPYGSVFSICMVSFTLFPPYVCCGLFTLFFPYGSVFSICMVSFTLFSPYGRLLLVCSTRKCHYFWDNWFWWNCVVVLPLVVRDCPSSIKKKKKKFKFKQGTKLVAFAMLFFVLSETFV